MADEKITEELLVESDDMEMDAGFVDETDESGAEGKAAQEPVSLETPIGEEEDSQLGDFIPDEHSVEPEAAAAESMIRDMVNNMLDDKLGERERKVIRMRYGIEDGQPRTLEEVGREFGVMRERIRQIVSKMLARLRQPSNSAALKDCLQS